MHDVREKLEWSGEADLISVLYGQGMIFANPNN